MLIKKSWKRFWRDCQICQFLIWNTEIADKSSTNAHMSTVCQITQQESKQVLKGIAKTCGILTDLLVNVRNGWKKRHCFKIVNQFATKIPFANLKNKKVSECWELHKESWYPDKLPYDYKNWLRRNIKKEKLIWNNSAIVMLCGFKIWVNSQILRLI